MTPEQSLQWSRRWSVERLECGALIKTDGGHAAAWRLRRPAHREEFDKGEDAGEGREELMQEQEEKYLMKEKRQGEMQGDSDGGGEEKVFGSDGDVGDEEDDFEGVDCEQGDEEEEKEEEEEEEEEEEQ
ncbi:sodium/potassium/calcium exchanger 1-like [Schistocerca americana]|uniref:sodium/potassium/calcium exchanger 1-like n=1 Tax=Schistocerca americana TaxID=7009 RepID=UPI001F501E92|nr:sodium/potassium/calcium exchanger 1-like [Schistocerca americana]